MSITPYVANVNVEIKDGRIKRGSRIKDLLQETYEGIRPFTLGNNILDFKGFISYPPLDHPQDDLYAFSCVLDIIGEDLNAFLSFGKTPITKEGIPVSIGKTRLELHFPTPDFFKESAYTPEGLFKARKITGLTKKRCLKNKIDFMEAFLLQRRINPRLINREDFHLLDYPTDQIGNPKSMLREVLSHHNEVYTTSLLRIVTSSQPNNAPF